MMKNKNLLHQFKNANEQIKKKPLFLSWEFNWLIFCFSKKENGITFSAARRKIFGIYGDIASFRCKNPMLYTWYRSITYIL